MLEYFYFLFCSKLRVGFFGANGIMLQFGGGGGLLQGRHVVQMRRSGDQKNRGFYRVATDPRVDFFNPTSDFFQIN